MRSGWAKHNSPLIKSFNLFKFPCCQSIAVPFTAFADKKGGRPLSISQGNLGAVWIWLRWMRKALLLTAQVHELRSLEVDDVEAMLAMLTLALC